MDATLIPFLIFSLKGHYTPMIRYTILALYKFICMYVCMHYSCCWCCI